MKKPKIKTPPWCPFCGQKIARPQPPVQRKLGEFSVGTCQCGAVYASDPTGHNIGEAMIEALVYACNDNWDLAWELLPEEDYLTGRIENYDEITHQVVETRNLDGRLIRGVIYFVRLHKDIAEITARFKAKATGEEVEVAPAASFIPEIEPAKDPKRKKQRANKTKVKELVGASDVDGLLDMAFDDVRTLWFMQRLLYDPDESRRWHTAHIIGQVCARLSTRQPGPVSDLLHRLFEACSDSAATPWGLVETIGSVIAARPDIYGAFTRHLLRHLKHPTTKEQTIWALGTIAKNRPDLIRNTPFYQLFDLLNDENPAVRGLMVRLLGRIKANEVKGTIEKLQDDTAPLTTYEEGKAVQTTVSELAKEALSLIHSEGGETSRG